MARSKYEIVVNGVLITTDEMTKYKGVSLPGGVEVWPRERIIEAQETLRKAPGVTVLIHDQQCAAEKRRDRKRGIIAEPPERVVINERTGTVIMGSQLRIATVAVAHGNLTIQIREQKEVSQPQPFAPKGAATVVVPKSEVTIKEETSRLAIVPEGVSIGDVVQALNALGVTPRDLISILQAIRQSGALTADLEIM